MKTYTLRDWRYWYGRASRCWWAARYGAEGNQIGDALNAASRSLIVTYIEMEETPMNLPEVRTDLRDVEKQAALSVDVLVTMEGFTGVWIGRYIHGCGEWQVNGMHGGADVTEWWPMPVAGTGNRVA